MALHKFEMEKNLEVYHGVVSFHLWRAAASRCIWGYGVQLLGLVEIVAGQLNRFRLHGVMEEKPDQSEDNG